MKHNHARQLRLFAVIRTNLFPPQLETGSRFERDRTAGTMPIRHRMVAKGVVPSECARIAKAVAPEMRGFRAEQGGHPSDRDARPGGEAGVGWAPGGVVSP